MTVDAGVKDLLRITLNQAVAVAMVDGPRDGLDLLAVLDDDESLADNHRLAAVRAHLLEWAGDRDVARDAYRDAARRTTSLPEQRYLEGRAARLARSPWRYHDGIDEGRRPEGARRDHVLRGPGLRAHPAADLRRDL